MLEWLKSHEYIAGWLAACAAVYPTVKSAAKGILITLLVWLMVGSAIMLMRLTMSEEAMNDVIMSLLLIVLVYTIVSSTQTSFKAQSEG